MKYLIHCYPPRMWYVNNFLVPALNKQGITDITIFEDKNYEGNLKSFINSLKYIRDNFNPNEGTWHLQDDILLSSSFGKISSNVNEQTLTCGFASKAGDMKKVDCIGLQEMSKSWMSFPCIMIPNSYSIEFIEWFEREVETKGLFNKRYLENKHDDFYFQWFCRHIKKNDKCLNLSPNIVDHIDYLINGSYCNKKRGKCSAYWWNETQQEYKDNIMKYKGENKL